MLIQLLVAVIVIAVVVWAVKTVLPALGLPTPLATIIYVAVVLIVVFWLLSFFGFVSAGPITGLGRR